MRLWWANGQPSCMGGISVALYNSTELAPLRGSSWWFTLLGLRTLESFAERQASVLALADRPWLFGKRTHLRLWVTDGRAGTYGQNWEARSIFRQSIAGSERPTFQNPAYQAVFTAPNTIQKLMDSAVVSAATQQWWVRVGAVARGPRLRGDLDMTSQTLALLDRGFFFPNRHSLTPYAARPVSPMGVQGIRAAHRGGGQAEGGVIEAWVRRKSVSTATPVAARLYGNRTVDGWGLHPLPEVSEAGKSDLSSFSLRLGSRMRFIERGLSALGRLRDWRKRQVRVRSAYRLARSTRWASRPRAVTSGGGLVAQAQTRVRWAHLHPTVSTDPRLRPAHLGWLPGWRLGVRPGAVASHPRGMAFGPWSVVRGFPSTYGARVEAKILQTRQTQLDFDFRTLMGQFRQPQVRYRPGISTYWRRYRRDFCRFFWMPWGYRQKRLTRYIARIRRVACFSYFRLVLFSTVSLLYTSQLAGALSLQQAYFAVKRGWVSVNGHRCSNPFLQVYRGDVLLWHGPELPVTGRMRGDIIAGALAPRASQFWESPIYRRVDAPEYVEIDELTSTLVVLYEPTDWGFIVDNPHASLPFLTLKCYNWKYIT